MASMSYSSITNRIRPGSVELIEDVSVRAHDFISLRPSRSDRWLNPGPSGRAGAWKAQHHPPIEHRQDLLQRDREIATPPAPDHQADLVHILDAPNVHTIVVVDVHPGPDAFGAHRDRLSASVCLV
jgi:hypothetical protein